MSAFNPMEGYTVAKNPWRNTSYGKGTHYFKTSTPQQSETQAQEAQRERFAQARQQAKQQCAQKSGMQKSECIANVMSSQLKQPNSNVQ